MLSTGLKWSRVGIQRDSGSGARWGDVECRRAFGCACTCGAFREGSVAVDFRESKLAGWQEFDT